MFGRLLGGVLALAALAAVASADTGCDRKALYGVWKQVDYMETRHRLLQERSAEPVELYRASKKANKRVVKGTWVSEYTGKRFEGVDPRGLHIDHIIPVCWAAKHGAAEWSRAKRREFYNDSELLFIIEAGINWEKGASGVMDYVPVTDFRCEYVKRFLWGVDKYGLSITDQDRYDLQRTVSYCSVG